MEGFLRVKSSLHREKNECRLLFNAALNAISADFPVRCRKIRQNGGFPL
jgi:hypothetical protein